MFDIFGPTAGLFARIRFVMLIAIFLAMGVTVNLKNYAGVAFSETAIGLVVCGCFLLSIVIAIVWHHHTAYKDN